MRSNATVGPPVELLIYPAGAKRFGKRLVLQEDNAYLRELRAAWQEGLEEAFRRLPVCRSAAGRSSLVDAQADS